MTLKKRREGWAGGQGGWAPYITPASLDGLTTPEHERGGENGWPLQRQGGGWGWGLGVGGNEHPSSANKMICITLPY